MNVKLVLVAGLIVGVIVAIILIALRSSEKDSFVSRQRVYKLRSPIVLGNALPGKIPTRFADAMDKVILTMSDEDSINDINALAFAILRIFKPAYKTAKPLPPAVAENYVEAIDAADALTVRDKYKMRSAYNLLKSQMNGEQPGVANVENFCDLSDIQHSPAQRKYATGLAVGIAKMGYKCGKLLAALAAAPEAGAFQALVQGIKAGIKTSSCIEAIDKLEDLLDDPCPPSLSSCCDRNRAAGVFEQRCCTIPLAKGGCKTFKDLSSSWCIDYRDPQFRRSNTCAAYCPSINGKPNPSPMPDGMTPF